MCSLSWWSTHIWEPKISNCEHWDLTQKNDWIYWCLSFLSWWFIYIGNPEICPGEFCVSLSWQLAHNSRYWIFGLSASIQISFCMSVESRLTQKLHQLTLRLFSLWAIYISENSKIRIAGVKSHSKAQLWAWCLSSLSELYIFRLKNLKQRLCCLFPST